MWFFLGAKFYGNIIFYIRGQHGVLKVKVIWSFYGESLELLLTNLLHIPDSLNCSRTCHFVCVKDRHIHAFFLKGVAKLFYSADKGTDILGETGRHTWCLIMMRWPSWNSSMALATSGPAIIKRSRTLGLPMTPTAPPFPLINALCCSCAWSIGIEENTFFVFRTVTLPALNSLATPGCFIRSAIMSLRRTQIFCITKICHTLAFIRMGLQYVQCCCSDLMSSFPVRVTWAARTKELAVPGFAISATSSQPVAERLQGGHLDVEPTKYHCHLVFAILLWPLPLNLLYQGKQWLVQSDDRCLARIHMFYSMLQHNRGVPDHSYGVGTVKEQRKQVGRVMVRANCG